VSSNKKELQKVEPKKFGPGAPIPETPGRGSSPPSNTHGDLAIQVNPLITLWLKGEQRRGQWGRIEMEIKMYKKMVIVRNQFILI